MLRRRGIFYLLFVYGFCFGIAGAADYTERRIVSSTKFFRVMLTADLDIKKKAVEGGPLVIHLIGSREGKYTEIVQKALVPNPDKPLKVRDISVKFEVYPVAQRGEKLKKAPAAIFITESLSPEVLNELVAFGIKQRIVVFSPFEGDVERGVLAGMAVEAKLRPYVNMGTLENAGVRLNPMLLRVAKRYE